MRVNARRPLGMSEAGDDRVQERPDAAVLHRRVKGQRKRAMRVPIVRTVSRSASVHLRHDALSDHRDASLLLG